MITDKFLKLEYSIKKNWGDEFEKKTKIIKFDYSAKEEIERFFEYASKYMSAFTINKIEMRIRNKRLTTNQREIQTIDKENWHALDKIIDKNNFGGVL